MDALSGGSSQSGDTTDWKAKYEEIQRELNSARVDQGRVRKLDEENKALQRQLEEERASRQSQNVIDVLPDDVKGDIPDEYLKAQSVVAQKATERLLASRDAEIEALKRQNAERDAREAALRKQRLDERFEGEFPGLAAQLGPGGDKHDAWINYRRYNGASIDAALAGFDFNSLAWHIRKFFTDELGIAPPSGGAGLAAPDPGSIGGGKPVVAAPGKTYTEAEIDALFDRKEAARDRGDWSEVKRLTDEINRAQAAAGQK